MDERYHEKMNIEEAVSIIPRFGCQFELCTRFTFSTLKSAYAKKSQKTKTKSEAAEVNLQT